MEIFFFFFALLGDFHELRVNVVSVSLVLEVWNREMQGELDTWTISIH